MTTFKERFPFEKRKQEADRIKAKYPDRVPVIVEKLKGSNVPEIDKNKFLCPDTITISQFLWILRKRIKLSPEQALFIFVNNTIPPASTLLSEIYKEHKSSCGFLYCNYSGEAVFGLKQD